MDTLVLNAAYQPINRVSWRDAFCLVFTGRAEVVETYADRVVRSAREVFPMPSIVRFVRRVSYVFRGGVKFNRKNLYLRDKGRCQYCGKKVSKADFTYDHVVPRKQGGRTVWKNVVIACFQCTQFKADRTPEQAGMRLLTQPVKPRSLPGTTPVIRYNDNMPPTWRDYLAGVSYWHAQLDDG